MTFPLRQRRAIRYPIILSITLAVYVTSGRAETTLSKCHHVLFGKIECEARDEQGTWIVALRKNDGGYDQAERLAASAPRADPDGGSKAEARSTTPRPERFPSFDGTIIPIEVPFQPEYREHRLLSDVRMTANITAGSDKVSLDFRIKAEQIVRRAGDRLEWNCDIREMTILGKRFKTQTPIMTARWVTDPRGNIEGFEMAFPGLKEAGVKDIPDQPKKGTAEYNKALRQFGAGRALPSKPIASGDVLFTQPLADLTEDLPGIDPETLQKSVRSVVQGWGYYGEQKVLVAQETFDVSVKDPNLASVTMSGYALFDADTFVRVKDDFVLIISGMTDGKPMYMRIHATSDGTETKQR